MTKELLSLDFTSEDLQEERQIALLKLAHKFLCPGSKCLVLKPVIKESAFSIPDELES